MPRKYEKVQQLLPEIQARIAAGQTQREIAEELGLQDKYVIHRLLTRERRKEEKLAEGTLSRPKGRPKKEEDPESELKRLRMENEPLRDFFSLTGRK